MEIPDGVPLCVQSVRRRPDLPAVSCQTWLNWPVGPKNRPKSLMGKVQPGVLTYNLHFSAPLASKVNAIT